jgi:hypothetical protein
VAEYIEVIAELLSKALATSDCVPVAVGPGHIETSSWSRDVA